MRWRLDGLYSSRRRTLDNVWCGPRPRSDERITELGQEAIWLARVLREQIPDDPEVRGLLALMLYCEARRPARRSAGGRFVPLSEQNPKDWSMPLIEEAEGELTAAFRMGRPGRYQIEAAIQSVH